VSPGTYSLLEGEWPTYRANAQQPTFDTIGTRVAEVVCRRHAPADRTGSHGPLQLAGEAHDQAFDRRVGERTGIAELLPSDANQERLQRREEVLGRHRQALAALT
jgi:hypothetical protein